MWRQCGRTRLRHGPPAGPRGARSVNALVEVVVGEKSRASKVGLVHRMVRVDDLVLPSVGHEVAVLLADADHDGRRMHLRWFRL